MTNRKTHAFFVGAGFALVFFLIRWGIFKLGLTPVSEPTPGDQIGVLLAWALQMFFEKGIGMLSSFLIALAVFVSLPDRSPKTRLACAILSAVLLEGFVIARYLLVWGLDAYQQCNAFWRTVQATLALSFIGGGIPCLIVMRRMRRSIEPANP